MSENEEEKPVLRVRNTQTQETKETNKITQSEQTQRVVPPEQRSRPKIVPSVPSADFGRREERRITRIVRTTGNTAEDIINKLRLIEDVPALRRGVDRIFDRTHRIRPGFSSSWITPEPPFDAKLLKEYRVGDTQVKLYVIPQETEGLYLVVPPEYNFPLEHMKLIDLTKKELTEHYPKSIQLSRPEQARKYVQQQGTEVIIDLARKNKIELGKTRAEEIEVVKKLAEVLAKYTAGMGISEVLLLDPFVQDIYVDAPASENMVYVTLGSTGDPRVPNKCITNVRLSDDDAESLLSRFRYESGRPFSEAFPVLECDLDKYSTRVTVIGKPLSPDGIALALRRHSTDPWTLLKLIYNKSISPLAAGFISFLIDGQSTILVAGSRGAGKSSLLGAIMLEFPQSQRIITIEDTLELPGPEMQALGYKLQSIHVRSSLGGKGEMTADEALRVSLRLGESSIVLGEVRGQETRTLYEAMRAGTAGSSVLGTIHGNSARAVYERVVYDMQIPAKSFNATDIIIIAGLRRPSGIQKQLRRVTQITELLKENTKEEGTFQDLMVYDEDVDSLVETQFFKKSEKIRSIANSWGMSIEDALNNIRTRGEIKKTIVDYVRKYENEDSRVKNLLTASWVVNSNNKFWELLGKHHAKGKINYESLVKDWKDWFLERVEYV